MTYYYGILLKIVAQFLKDIFKILIEVKYINFKQILQHTFKISSKYKIVSKFKDKVEG